MAPTEVAAEGGDDESAVSIGTIAFVAAKSPRLALRDWMVMTANGRDLLKVSCLVNTGSIANACTSSLAGTWRSRPFVNLFHGRLSRFGSILTCLLSAKQL